MSLSLKLMQSASRLPHFLMKLTSHVTAFSIFSAYSITPAFAQAGPSSPGVIVDPEADVSFQPNVWLDGSVPIVDITTPENGVSLNQYQDFNVAENGLVLNNATQDGISALVGALRANPNFQGESAEIIINEITSGNFTDLAGVIEVFGQSADVIIANPNGIVANGTGFINTNRATLTTGVPTIGADGSVDLEVRGGHIEVGRVGIYSGDRVGEDGSNLTGAETLQISGRTVKIDGSISGSNNLIVSGGAQDFDPVIGEAIARSSAVEADSSFAVDATHYGVMQSDSIKVMGNEEGLGVRALGNLSSGQGGTDIMSLDDLFLGSSSTTGDLNARAAGGLTVNRDVSAQGVINLEAGTDGTGSLTIKTPAGTAGFFAGETANLSAGTDVSLAGDIQVTTDLNVTGRNITSDAEITIGTLGGSINLSATGDVDVSAGRLGATTINIDAGNEARIGETYVAATDVNVNATDVALGENVIFSADTIVLTALEDFENSAQIIGSGDDALNITLNFTQDFRNLASGVYLWDAIDLTIAGSLTNSGWIQGEESVALALGSLNNLATGVITGGTVAIDTSGDFVNAGDIISDTILSVQAQEEVLNTGRLSSGGNLSIDAVQRIRQGGYIASGGNLTLSTDANINTYVGGVINRTDAEGEAYEVTSGMVFADGGIRIDAGTVYGNSLESVLQATGALNVVAGGNVSNYGMLQTVEGDLGVVSATGYIINQRLGGIFSGQDLVLTTGQGYITNAVDGQLAADRNALITSNTTFNNYGLLQTLEGDISLSTTTGYILNRGSGVISAGQDLSLTSHANYITNSTDGWIGADRNVVLTAHTTLNNYGAILTTTGDLDVVTSTRYILNRGTGVFFAGQDLNLVSAAEFITNSTGGQIIANRNASLTAHTNFNNYGLLDVEGDRRVLLIMLVV